MWVTITLDRTSWDTRYVQEVLSICVLWLVTQWVYYENWTGLLGTRGMSKKSCPFWCINSPYKSGQDFFSTRVNDFLVSWKLYIITYWMSMKSCPFIKWLVYHENWTGVLGTRGMSIWLINLPYNIGQDFLGILYTRKLLYKMRQDFLDIQYIIKRLRW